MVQLHTALPPAASLHQQYLHGSSGMRLEQQSRPSSGGYDGSLVVGALSAGQTTKPIPIPTNSTVDSLTFASDNQQQSTNTLRLLNSASTFAPQRLSLSGRMAVQQRSPTPLPLVHSSAAVPCANDGYFCFNSTTLAAADAQTMEIDDQLNDDDDDDEDVTSISPRSSVDESQGYKSDGSWSDDGVSNDSADVLLPVCGPLWPENAYRREMLDVSISKLQAMTARPTCLRKSVLIFNTMKYLQDELSTQSSMTQESGDEELELDMEEPAELPAVAPMEQAPAPVDFSAATDCVSYLWPTSNQVPVPHPWSSSMDDQFSCWSYQAVERMDSDDSSLALATGNGYQLGGFVEAPKRQCVSHEILASYELLNRNAGTTTSSTSVAANTTTVTTSSQVNQVNNKPQSQYAGFFDPLHHEGLNDMDLLATLGLKDLSHNTFVSHA